MSRPKYLTDQATDKDLLRCEYQDVKVIIYLTPTTDSLHQCPF
jgi:hypothetical protein